MRHLPTISTIEPLIEVPANETLTNLTANASGPTLHHEDDIRIEGRIEEVDQCLGAQLCRTCTRSVSGALCTREIKMEPKQRGRLGEHTTPGCQHNRAA